MIKTHFYSNGFGKKVRPFFLICAALVGLASCSVEDEQSQETDRAANALALDVSKPLTAKAGDSANGRKLYYSRKLGNCIACHANKDLADQPFHGEIGPAIDGVGARYSSAELRAIIVDPKKVFGDGTIMPAFYTTKHGARTRKEFQGKTILSAQDVEDLIVYLRALK